MLSFTYFRQQIDKTNSPSLSAAQLLINSFSSRNFIQLNTIASNKKTAWSCGQHIYLPHIGLFGRPFGTGREQSCWWHGDVAILVRRHLHAKHVVVAGRGTYSFFIHRHPSLSLSRDRHTTRNSTGPDKKDNDRLRLEYIASLASHFRASFLPRDAG